jgi:hypothetical protein
MKSVGLYRISQIGILVCTLNVFSQVGSNNVEQWVNSILSQMTLDEKISYIGGTHFFDVKPIPLSNLQAPLNPQIYRTPYGDATSSMYDRRRSLSWKPAHTENHTGDSGAGGPSIQVLRRKA